jgi:hypothetical protein
MDSIFTQLNELKATIDNIWGECTRLRIKQSWSEAPKWLPKDIVKCMKALSFCDLNGEVKVKTPFNYTMREYQGTRPLCIAEALQAYSEADGYFYDCDGGRELVRSAYNRAYRRMAAGCDL